MQTDRLLQDAFPERFTYNTTGPDFLDTWNGTMVELTTTNPATIAKHKAKGGDYLTALYAGYAFPS